MLISHGTLVPVVVVDADARLLHDIACPAAHLAHRPRLAHAR